MVEPISAAAAATTAEPPKDAVASLAAQVRHADMGTQARLRRFHPRDEGRAALFETEWMLQAAQVQPNTDGERERWAVLVHCLAIVRGAHQRGQQTEPGRVLAELRFSEARLRQLVEADADVLADLLPRLARRLAASGKTVDWRPLAELLLYTGTSHEDRSDRARQRLIRKYLETQTRSKTEAAEPDTAPQGA